MMRRILLSSTVLLAAAAAAGAQSLSPHANYILHCSGCHGMAGEGSLIGGIPTFVDSVGNIAGTETGRIYMVHVPGLVSADLTPAETADVVNYLLDEWGEGARRFTPEEVTRLRAVAVADVVAYRRRVAADVGRQGLPIAEYPWP